MSWRPLLSKRVHELRFIFSQTSPVSANVRSFIKKEYPVIKQANPTLPILIREAEAAEPVMIARYDLGKEKMYSLAGLTEQQINERLEDAASK